MKQHRLIRESERDARRFLLILFITLAALCALPAVAQAQEAPEPPYEEETGEWTTAPPPAPPRPLEAVSDNYTTLTGKDIEVDLLANDYAPEGAFICSLLSSAREQEDGFSFREEGQSLERGKMTYSAPPAPGTYRWKYSLCRFSEEGQLEETEKASVTFRVAEIELSSPPLPPEEMERLRADVRAATKAYTSSVKTFRNEVRALRKADSKAEKREARADVRVAARKAKVAAGRLQEARASLRAAEGG